MSANGPSGPRTGAGTRPSRPAGERPSPCRTRTSASAERSPRDHVRFPAGQRLDEQPFAVGGEAPAHQLVPGRVPAPPRRRAVRARTSGGAEHRPGARARQGERTARSRRATDTGFPGSPNTSLALADAERDRLARFHRDAPEHLLDTKLRLDSAHEIVWPDRNAPGRDEDICLEPARNRVAVRVLVVGDRAQPFDRRPGRRKLCIDEHAVRLVDLARARAAPPDGEARSRSRARRPAASAKREPRRCRRPERCHLSRAEAHTRLDDDVAAAQIAAARA